jgi:hypothetical protein
MNEIDFSSLFLKKRVAKKATKGKRMKKNNS